MARIPTLEQNRLDTRAMPQQRSALDTRGTNGEAIARGVGALAQGLEQATRDVAAVQAIQRQERERQVSANTAGAVGKLREFVNVEMDDDEKGFMRQKGEAALGNEKGLYERLEKERSRIVQGLPTPEAKERFELEAAELLSTTRLRAERHMGQARDDIANTNLQASEATSLDTLANTFDDPVSRAEALRAPERHIRGTQRTTEEGDARIADWRAKGHGVVLQRYLSSGRATEAKAYFDTIEKELGAGAEPIRKRIEGEANAQAGRVAASKIATETRDRGSAWLDVPAALAKVNALPDTDPAKEETKKHLLEIARESDALKERAVAQKLNALTAIHESGGSMNSPEVREIEAYLLDEPNDGALALAKFRKGLAVEGRAAGNYDARLRREQNEKNRFALSKIDAMDDEELASYNPFKDPDIDADLTTYNRMVGGIRRRLEAKQRGEGTGESEVRSQARSDAEADPSLRSNKQEKQLFISKMVTWGRDFEAKNKRKPTQAELNGARDEALLTLKKEREGMFKILGPKTVRGYQQPMTVPTVPGRQLPRAQASKATDGAPRTVVKTMRSRSTGKVKITYSDGTEEIR